MKMLLTILATSNLVSKPVLVLNYNQIQKITKIKPFHPTIKIDCQNRKLHTSVWTRSWGDEVVDNDDESKEIDWTRYANNKETFLKYYKTITIYFNASYSSSFGYNNNFNGPISFAIPTTNEYTYDFFNWKHSGIQNYVANSASITIYWIGNSLCFNYYVKSYVKQGSNLSYTSSEANLNISEIKLNSNLELDTVKNNLQNALNKEVELFSDYSGSLEDKRNIIDPSGKNNDITTIINYKIKKVLGDEYDGWKKYILPYSYDNKNNIATVTIKFNEPINRKQIVWNFKSQIKINLSNIYWNKSLKERLTTIPGKVVNKEDSTKGLETDKAIQLETDKITEKYGGNLQYHTSTHINFDGLNNSSEWITVNGTKVEVLNNKFTYDMIDNRIKGNEKLTNLYDVIIHHDDGVNKFQYEIKYTIDSLIPEFKAKWYAWEPNKNPDQSDLIKPNFPDGKPNPKYDREVNKETGTKTQILWINKKSQYPFALDPLNRNGEVIKTDGGSSDYDLGFLAEGSVSGMGVQQLFNDIEVDYVMREQVDENLKAIQNPNEIQKITKIKPYEDNKYWSWEGFWHYIIKTKDGLVYEKYVLIGAEYQKKYPRFLDVLNNTNTAVNFWTTIHGVHLKNYLSKAKNLDSRKISKLNFEQVSSYWKEYCSAVISQWIPPDPTPLNYIDITGEIPEIKLNETDETKLKKNINKEIEKYISKKQKKAKLNEDYVITTIDGLDINLENNSLRPLLNNKSEAQYLNFIVKTLLTSTLLIGQANFIVKNSINYNPDTVKDLSKIEWKDYKYNFSHLNVEDVKKWILKNNENYFKKYNFNDLILNVDYGIVVNKIPYTNHQTHRNTPSDLSNELLYEFLNNSIELKTITIIVYADNASDLAVGQSQFTLTNDINYEPTPTNPTDPSIEETNKITEKILYWEWIFPTLIGLFVFTTITLFFIRNKNKKGLGGRKIRKDT